MNAARPNARVVLTRVVLGSAAHSRARSDVRVSADAPSDARDITSRRARLARDARDGDDETLGTKRAGPDSVFYGASQGRDARDDVATGVTNRLNRESFKLCCCNFTKCCGDKSKTETIARRRTSYAAIFSDGEEEN